ncbi:MFS transporter [Streptomyces radicis]|uniref:MFS transporter n=1 Tax=Streptomyces radicis TaxID=1750517 RepID=A0A3A9W354_9ACTN|nr:MFS transporter [Streptomyces radicis]RKN07618.1 MFS transporter [Streptomyces radicis]RKN18341.1 MFS transporter [Streptomyces radicis]
MSGPNSPAPRRWWALAALALSVLVLGFDITILNVALPTLAVELDASTGEQQWIVDAFLVVFAATMLPAGLLGDRFGRRRMLVAGLVVLGSASLLGAFAQSPEVLIAARASMGLGGALVSPLALAVIPTLFAPDERARAIATLAAALATSLPLGPVLGGWLLDHHWWGSILLLNVPLAAVGALACLLLVPESRDPTAPRLDPLSALLSVGGLGALVFGLIEGPGRGWADPLVPATLLGSAAMLTLLVLRERDRPHPLLATDLLRTPGFAWNGLVAGLVGFAFAGLLFVVPQYLQVVRGHDAFATGLRLTPMMAGTLVAARACPPLVRLFGQRGVVSTGLVLLCFAGLLASTTTEDTGYALTATWLTVIGVGGGLALVPAVDGAVAALPDDRSGAGSGLLMTLRQMGSALGVALLGSLLAQTYRGAVDTDGLPPDAAAAARESVVAAHLVAERVGAPRLIASADEAFLRGMSVTLFVCALAALATAALAALLLPRGTPHAAGAESLARPTGDGRQWRP